MINAPVSQQWSQTEILANHKQFAAYWLPDRLDMVFYEPVFNLLPSMLLILQVARLLMHVGYLYLIPGEISHMQQCAQSRHKLLRDVWPAFYCSYKEPEGIVYQSDPWDQPCRPSIHTHIYIHVVLNSWVLLATVRLLKGAKGFLNGIHGSK